VANLVARKNILAARKRATKIRGGATMVASCVRGLRSDYVHNVLSENTKDTLQPLDKISMLIVLLTSATENISD
jgi:hypothetical protein